MMKHKVSELEGVLLDAAVALAEGWEFGAFEHEGRSYGWRLVRETRTMGAVLSQLCPPEFSTDWRDGGPIIERERVYPVPQAGKDEWVGWWEVSAKRTSGISGPTPLIAAMRAFVASRFGDEVELP